MHSHMLTTFFNKHPQEFNVMTALKCIEKLLEAAKKSHKKDKQSKKYICYLMKAYKMIEDLMMEVDPDHTEIKKYIPPGPGQQYN